MADARDGSTAAAFDSILRCYSEGCTAAQNAGKPIAKTENLIACIGPGTFSTMGTYDYVINVPHTNPVGFTIGKGWKIHGAGADKTIIKLAGYLPITDAKNRWGFPANTGTGLIFSTNSDNASGIEISDLTMDGNYPELKSRARSNDIKALTIEAIHLRSDEGGHWIHNVNVMNTAGEIGGIHIRWEAFPVWIVSMNKSVPGQNHGNVIENVHMRQSFGDTGCAITLANAIGEVRNNNVDGYPIGYGGWDMGEAVFHNNTAVNTGYGFNIDSLVNNGVRIEENQIVHPRKYGIVVGGGGTYANFKLLKNTVLLNQPGSFGLIFQGNVTGAIVAGNKILADSSALQATAIRQSGQNNNNVYQDNQIAGGLTIALNASQPSQNCFFANLDENGKPRKDLPNNRNGSCISGESK